MIESKLDVSFAIPVCRELVEYLPDRARALPESSLSIHSMLTDDFITRHDDLRDSTVEDAPAVQMIVNYEVFAPGTRFAHCFVLDQPTDIELGVLGRAIELWRENPVVGGRSAMGYGRVDLQYSNVPSPDPWTEFMKTRADEICGMLKVLENAF
ncbi:MAG: hypothetical protein N3G75_06720 [Methanothrix sp.]|nr:hypothetical protein [Methanothrix sp.]MCX8207509.1 hypothetical protein [Methanothrix sp.]